MSMVTGPEVNASARSGGSSVVIRSVTAATPDSTARHCSPVKRRANPVGVVEASPGTGDSACPAVSARTRSSPTRKSCPASCADAIPTSSSPAPNPLSRCLIGAHRHVQQPDYVQPVQQLGDRDQTAVAGQARIRRADPHPPTRTLAQTTTYPAHQMGAAYLLDKSVLTNRIVPGRNGTNR